MALFKGEGELRAGADPIVAFLHDKNSPRDAIIGPTGEIIDYRKYQESQRAVLPVVLIDLSTGREREISTSKHMTEEIVNFLEPQRKIRENPSKLHTVKRPLGVRKLVSLFPTILG